MVRATPSSSLLSTISSAAWSTSGWALATAYAHPEHAKSFVRHVTEHDRRLTRMAGVGDVVAGSR
jgi:hypothetical protein